MLSWNRLTDRRTDGQRWMDGQKLKYEAQGS